MIHCCSVGHPINVNDKRSLGRTVDQVMSAQYILTPLLESSQMKPENFHTFEFRER